MLWGSFTLGVAAQQTQSTSSESTRGSARAGPPRVGNAKVSASANQAGKITPTKPSRGRTVNTRTTNATGSTQEGTHDGVRSPGSSANPRIHAANAPKTDKPATGGDAGQGTPGVHEKHKTEAQKYSGTQGASGGGGPKQ